MREYQQFIDGEWVKSEELFDDLDPYRGTPMARIADEPQLPLGGVKDSGWGRSGPESMADFTEVQWITTRDGTGHYPI